MNTSKNYLRNWVAIALVSYISSACATTTEQNADWRESTLIAAANLLEREYIYEDKGALLAKYLRGNNSSYGALANKSEFARQVTLDLYALVRDKHLRIDFEPGNSSLDEMESENERPKLAYCETASLTYESINNVGFIQLPRFFGDDAYTARFDAAMIELSKMKALILDLRDNCGGGPALVRHISTYFFEKKTHLVSTEVRGEEAKERWTLDYVPGPRFLEKPVYILTNRKTFSAAESFAFGMQTTGRAIIVGERSGGGGHFGDTHRLSKDFTIFIPVGRTFDPRTGKGWETGGIVPDMELSSEQAVETALEAVRSMHE